MPDKYQGWLEDPWGRHEARYFSAGQPTDLVRDGTSEGRDAPPDEPPKLSDPAPLKLDKKIAPLRKRPPRSIPGFVLYIACVVFLVVLLFGWRILSFGSGPSVLAGLDTNCQSHSTAALHLDSAPIVLDSDVPVVGVCIHGTGPYPFVVDSGASVTLMSADLAGRLHLNHTGASVLFGSGGCSARAWPTQVNGWSAGTLALPSGQTVFVGPLRGLPDGIEGLLGSDVLSQFGGIRIDYSSSRLLVAGSEPSPGFSIRGLQGVVLHIPRELVAGTYNLSTPVAVVYSEPSGVALLAQVLVNGREEQFKVDTGSSASMIDSAVEEEIAQEGQITTGGPETVAGPFCIYATQEVENLNVRVGGSSTNHGPLLVGTGFERGVQGVLGADVLVGKQVPEPWILLDYRDGYLLVGSN